MRISRHIRRALVTALGGALAVAGTGLVPAEAAPNWLATGAYLNDPRATGAEQNIPGQLVIHHFDHAPAGSLVRVTTWNLTDRAIGDAMVRAMDRGVTVRVILPHKNCDSAAVLTVSAAALTHAGSWVLCSVGSTRSAGGTMHQKSYTFSQVDNIRYVTIVGSANATVEGYVDQWTDLYQFVNRKDLYNAYNDVFSLQQNDKNLSKPYRSFSFDGGKTVAKFYPVNDPSPTASDDPVHQRLTSLPKNKHTEIWVAMYQFSGDRGSWLAKDLIAHRRAGSKVVVLAGPGTDPAIVQKLTAAKISVTWAMDPGCVSEASCDYIHLKLMTARYRTGKTQRYRVWTGSDNWATGALNNDEVTQQISGKAAYQQYAGFLDEIQRTYAAS